MKKIFFLLAPIALSAQMAFAAQTYQVETSQGTTQPASTQTTTQQVYYRPTSQTGPVYSSPSYQGTTPQKTAWHNTPNRENYYDDPNWPNIKR